jgi:hypothetical protein
MARRTIKECQQEIDALKAQLASVTTDTSAQRISDLERSVKILGDEIVKRNAYILDIERDLNQAKEEMDQQPDGLPGYVSIQARFLVETVALAGKLKDQLGAVNRTEVLERGLHLLEESLTPLKTRLARKAKGLLRLSMVAMIGLMGCAASAPSARPISYPWLCEQEAPKVGQCTLLGYEVNTDNHYVAEMFGDAICDHGPKSITANPHKHEFLIVCK